LITIVGKQHKNSRRQDRKKERLSIYKKTVKGQAEVEEEATYLPAEHAAYPDKIRKKNLHSFSRIYFILQI